MKSVVLLLVSLLTLFAKSAEVQWNVFSIYDWDDYMGGGDGRSIQYYNGSRTPEAGFIVSGSVGYTRTLTFTGGYSNVGNNSTFWAVAAADTLINYDWMQSVTPLLDIGLDEYREGGAFKLISGQSKYIAMIGKDISIVNDDVYYAGWVQIKNNKGEIEIVSSAFAEAALYVGSGATAGFAGPASTLPTPEPTSGLLMAVGIAVLSLRRRMNHDDFAED